MKFFKPTLWKIIISFIIFLCFVWFISVFWTFYGIALCPLKFPSLGNSTASLQNSELFEPRPLPHSFTSARFDDTVIALQAILQDNFNRCANRPNPSLTLAWNILTIASYMVALAVSYLLACVLILLANKNA